MSARSRGTKALALGVLVGGLAFGTGGLFFAVSNIALEYSTRKSFLFAAIGVIPVMLVALPATWIGMRTSPESLSREPLLRLLNDFIRLTIAFAIAALFAVFGIGLLSSGSLASGGLASIFALAVAYVAYQRLQTAVVRLKSLGNRNPKERSDK